MVASLNFITTMVQRQSDVTVLNQQTEYKKKSGLQKSSEINCKNKLIWLANVNATSRGNLQMQHMANVEITQVQN